MFFLQILIHHTVYGKMFLFIILWIMADVIANSGRCQNHFVLLFMLGRCYCLILADVIAKFDRYYCQHISWCYCLCIIIFGWCYCQLCGRCYTTNIELLQQGWRLMLLRGGRWNGHCRVTWQMLLPWVRCYFNFSSEVLSRTSSHMWGRWYLPMFLLRDGLLTLMYNASLIVLLRFWSSLPTILKLSIVTWWPLMLLWSNIGEGAFWCSLNLSAKVQEDSPMYSSSQSTLPHLNL